MPNTRGQNPRGFNCLFAKVDIASIVYFRVIFGLVMLWTFARYFTNNWLEGIYIVPTYFFPYPGFEWVQPLPGSLMYSFFTLICILAACITLGIFYRVTSALFCLCFIYLFLCDQSAYDNDQVLYIAISFLLAIIPAHRSCSVDALQNPEIKSSTIPVWYLWLLQIQIGVAYFFGGLCKTDIDWLNGWPLRISLSTRTDFPIIGKWFTEEWMIYFFSYSGLLIDALIAPLILWKRTRWFGVVVIIMFHTINAINFKFVILPWAMIGITMIFLPPDWPRALWNHMKKKKYKPISTKPAKSLRWTRQKRLVAGFMTIFIILNLFIPVRHYFYPGRVSWNEEGHNFSWHWMLRTKVAIPLKFYVTDSESKYTTVVDPRDYLTKHQRWHMSFKPDLIVIFSNHLEKVFKRTHGYKDVEVRVECKVSLNGRKPQYMIDPTADLTKYKQDLSHAPYIVPLTEPMPSIEEFKKRVKK